MEEDSGGGETVEAIITCDGHLDDPNFKKNFSYLLRRLKRILSAGIAKAAELVVRKMEPWNSVRVTFSVPREAALRLRHLAQQGDATLRTLGILTVQIEGDQVISLTLAGRNNGPPQEIVLRTEDPGVASTSAASQQRALTDLMAAASGAERLQPAATPPQPVAFPIPNVVAPVSQPLPYSATKLQQRAANTYPFNSMSHAAAAAAQHRELAPPPPPPPPYPGGMQQQQPVQQAPQMVQQPVAHHQQPMLQQQQAATPVSSMLVASPAAPTPPATPSPAPLQTTVPVSVQPPSATQLATVTSQLHPQPQLAKPPPLTTMGSPLLVNLLKSEANAAPAEQLHAHVSRVQTQSPLSQLQHQQAVAAARLAQQQQPPVRMALKQRVSPVLQAQQRGSPVQQLVRRSPPVTTPRVSSPVMLPAQAAARHSPVSQLPLRASPVQLPGSPAARPPATGLMRPHPTRVALVTHPGRHHVQAAAAAAATAATPVSVQQVGNGSLVQVNNGPTRLVQPPTRTYSAQQHHLKQQHQQAVAARPALHPTLPGAAPRQHRPEPMPRHQPPPPNAAPVPRAPVFSTSSAYPVSSCGPLVSASASSVSASSGLQFRPGAGALAKSSHHLSPGGSHTSGLHDDLDPKRIPPVPPEDIFSHDSWEPPPPPMRLGPETASTITSTAPPAISSASLALTVAASLSAPAKVAPPAPPAPVTVATVSCVHVPAASLQLENALRTGTVRIDGGSDGLRKEVLTHSLERKVNDVCGAQAAAAARLSGTDGSGGASGTASAPHATKVDGSLDSPSVTPKGDPVNGQGEDSGIESMDTQSEKSPNQEESPHRKEELDSHEKHHDPHHAPPAGHKTDLSTDQALERVPSRTFKTESIRVTAVNTLSAVAGVSCAPVVSSGVSASVANSSSVSTGDKVQLVIKVNKPKPEVSASNSSNSLAPPLTASVPSVAVNNPKPPPEPSGSATINFVQPPTSRSAPTNISRPVPSVKAEVPPVTLPTLTSDLITDSLALSKISSIAAELQRGAEASVAQRNVAVNFAASSPAGSMSGSLTTAPTPQVSVGAVASSISSPAVMSLPASEQIQVKPVTQVKPVPQAKPVTQVKPVAVKLEAPERPEAELTMKAAPSTPADVKPSIGELAAVLEAKAKTEPATSQPEVKRKVELSGAADPPTSDMSRVKEAASANTSTPAAAEDCKPAISTSSVSAGRTTPLNLPPGSKMLPIKLIKAVNSSISSRTGACSPQTPVPTRSAAPVAVAAAPAAPTPARPATEHRDTSPEPPVLSPAVSGETRTAPVRRSDSKDLPPELENPDEPELLRVNPPLYTYSNPDKARESSLAEEMAEEDSIVGGASEILDEILQKEAVSKVESDHSYLKPNRKSLEELSIQIPDGDGAGDGEKRATRSTRANSRLHSPNTTTVSSPTPTAAPSAAKASPQPRGAIVTSPTSRGAAGKRRRCESGGSCASAADDAAPSRRADTPDAVADAAGVERSRRRCSENAAGLIKACMGVEEHRTRPATPNNAAATAAKADTPRRARASSNKKDEVGSDDEFDRRSTRSTDETTSHRPNHRTTPRTNHASAAIGVGGAASTTGATAAQPTVMPAKAESKHDDKSSQERSTGRASRARTRESKTNNSRSGSAESLDGAGGRKAKTKGGAKAGCEPDTPTGTGTPQPFNNVNKRKLRNSNVGVNDSEAQPTAKRRRVSRDK